jgi:AcrR family transcriptional regulator
VQRRSSTQSGARAGRTEPIAKTRQGRASSRSRASPRPPARTAALANERGRATAKRILEGAINALCAQGLAALTTRAIASAAGVRLATLHYHFETKDALLLSVFDALTTQADASLRAGIRPSRDLRECIDHTLEAGWRSAVANRPLQIVQYELTLYALRTRGAEWLAQRQYRDYRRALETVFIAHVPNTPAGREFVHELAHFVLAGLDGIILQHLVDADDSRAQRAIELVAVSAKAFAESRRPDYA